MVTTWSWARPCSMPIRFSDRFSAQRTGRPTCRASQAIRAYSGSAPILAPKPPPTSGVIRWIRSGSILSQSPNCPLACWAPWLVHQTVTRPSSPQAAAAARLSSGTGATRWLTIDWVTTTSQPSKKSAGAGSPNEAMTLVPASGNSSTSSEAAAAVPTTAGSGSTSTATISAASSPWYRSSVRTTAMGSPTNRTRSDASHGRVIARLTNGKGGGIGTSSARSSAVTTATTPGASRAAEVSTDSNRPWATVDRTKVACSAPVSRSSARSSV